MRAESKPSFYEINCISSLKSLYGDYDALISAWEALLDESAGQEPLRRAIASAHFAKHERRWSLLSQSELRRIVGLMEANLRDNPGEERDLRMWFEAYRRLPEFTYLEAIDRLEAWVSRAEALDAHYYLYILHFLLWRSGIERNQQKILYHLERCSDLAVGRRGHSYEWLGTAPEWCPLIHHLDLGEFDRKKRFSLVSGKVLCEV